LKGIAIGLSNNSKEILKRLKKTEFVNDIYIAGSSKEDGKENELIQVQKPREILLKKWHDKPEEVMMPEGESIKDVSERSVEAFDKICLSQKDNDLTLLVAHDAVNKTLICNILGINYSNIWMIKQGNGGITIIDLFNDSNKPPVISALNITTHLGGIIDSTASGAL